MEVHKHPHHVTHKKKWGEYLLEFFMLFLAVFLGFVAENVREGFNERKKEKHLISALNKDLLTDTARLILLIKTVSLHNTWVDSAIAYLNSDTIKGKEKEIAVSLNNATAWFTYTTPDIAIADIRNTGSINLIENEKAKEGILKYISRINMYNKYSEPLNNARHSMDTSLVSIFRSGDYQKIIQALYITLDKGNSFLNVSDLPYTFIFKTYDLAEFKRLSTKLEQENILENDMFGQYGRLYANDTTLISLLKKEYHLGND